jgi:hypothetical protein
MGSQSEKSSGSVVSARVLSFLDRAAQCERMAAKASDSALKSTFEDAAAQWRQVADRVGRWERTCAEQQSH